jgi:hypothetical protein
MKSSNTFPNVTFPCYFHEHDKCENEFCECSCHAAESAAWKNTSQVKIIK